MRTVLVLVGIVTACVGPDRLPPTTLAPPQIGIVGIVAAQTIANDVLHYTLADGRELTVSTNDRRVLTHTTGFLGGILITGIDQQGPFLASYGPQGGLPADCYVDNSAGVDRGPYVELRGVLWEKSPGFVAAQPVRNNYAYPGATRFCFDANGHVASTVAP